MKANVTTTLDAGLYSVAKQNKISWAEALEFGLKFLLAEKDPISFIHPSNTLKEKITSLTERIQDLHQRLEILGQKQNVTTIQ